MLVVSSALPVRGLNASDNWQATTFRLQVSMSTYIHDLRGSTELSQTLRHMRIGIPYNAVLNELSARTFNP